MSFDVDRFTELARQAVQEAIAGHHAAGRSTCHADSQGLYLLFPDQSTRYFPADKFPSGEPQRIPYFLKWCDFMRGLFAILSGDEWARVALRFGYRDNYGPFYVEIEREGVSAESWQAACELAKRIEGEHSTEQEYLA